MNFKLKTPLNIVILWWIFWGIISTFSFTGLYVPGQKTYLVLMTLVVSLFAGGKLVNVFNRLFKKEIQISNEVSKKKLDFILKVSSIALFAVLLVLLVKSIFLIYSSFTPTVYRSNAFSTLTTTGLLFGNRLLESIYFTVSSPLLFFVTLYALVDFWEKERFQKLFIAFALNGMDAYIRLGRVNLYLILVLFTIIFFISDFKVMTFIRTRKKQIMALVASVVCILYIGVQRGYSPTQQFNMFVIDYHTVGFSLFDHELTDKTSPLNTTTTYGRLSFGGLETLATIFVRQVNRDYYSPALINSIRMSKESIVVGVENPPTVIFNGVKVYNSFYTMLYTFYSDGGFFGVVIGGLVLGFLLEFFYRRYINYHRTLDAFSLIFVISVSILSIFMSQLEIMRTWIIVLLLIYLYYDSKVVEQNANK